MWTTREERQRELGRLRVNVGRQGRRERDKES